MFPRGKARPSTNFLLRSLGKARSSVAEPQGTGDAPGIRGLARLLQRAARGQSPRELSRYDFNLFHIMRECMKPLFLVFTAAMSALAVGCIEGESYQSELAGDEIGHIQQAVNEQGCGTIALSSAGNEDGISRPTPFAQESPDWTYNLGSDCPYQYVVEYTNLPAFDPTKDLSFEGRFANGDSWSDITNEVDCERTHLHVGTYVWNSNTTNPSSSYGRIFDGHWSGTTCSPVLSSSTVSPSGSPNAIPPLDGKFKARIAMRALYCAFADGCAEAQRTNLKVQSIPVWIGVVN